MSEHSFLSVLRGALAPMLITVVLTAPTVAAQAQTATGWQAVIPSGPILGADGRMHRATCTAYPGSDPTYRFYVRPGTQPNVMVYFQGGGGCWDHGTCSTGRTLPLPDPTKAQIYNGDIDPPSLEREIDGKSGLLDAQRSDNPVAGWTHVYVPYCTADLHVGGGTRTWLNTGNLLNPWMPFGQPFQLEHRGFDNVMVILDWMQRNLPAPQQLLVTGGSAGGYGAMINFPWFARQYPQARISVIGDASQGVIPAAFDRVDPGRVAWNPQFAPWVWGSDASQVPSSSMLQTAAAAYPNVRFGRYTTMGDTVQVGVFALMKAQYAPLSSTCVDPTLDWRQRMLDGVTQLRATSPNVRQYLAPGTSHTVLADAKLYTDMGGGTSVARWVRGILGQAGAPFSDAACLTCNWKPGCAWTP